MLTGENITDEEIRALREQSAQWLDNNPASAVGDRIRIDDWAAQHLAFRSAQIALGELRPRRGSTKRAARARCAAILNERASRNVMDGGTAWPPDDGAAKQCQCCGEQFLEGPTSRDRERFARGVCGACEETP